MLKPANYLLWLAYLLATEIVVASEGVLLSSCYWLQITFGAGSVHSDFGHNGLYLGPIILG
jgi:hypothetical protein